MEETLAGEDNILCHVVAYEYKNLRKQSRFTQLYMFREK